MHHVTFVLKIGEEGAEETAFHRASVRSQQPLHHANRRVGSTQVLAEICRQRDSPVVGFLIRWRAASIPHHDGGAQDEACANRRDSRKGVTAPCSRVADVSKCH